MRKVNLKDIPEQERTSPKGTFHKFVKDIYIALGRDRDSLDLAKRHPFDLAGENSKRQIVLPVSLAFGRIGTLPRGFGSGQHS